MVAVKAVAKVQVVKAAVHQAVVAGKETEEVGLAALAIRQGVVVAMPHQVVAKNRSSA